jgi:hypothetical protein
MSGTQALERGYRRLLAWYPTWHRQAHGEEMIGVLLAAAPGDRRRPGLGETLNIIWAGLLIRLRPRARALPSGAWPDALAVFSVVAPVALTCLAIAWDLAGGSRISPANVALAAVFYGLGLPLPLVLLRLRRVAAVVSLLATGLLAVASASVLLNGGFGEPFTFSLFAYAAETAALFGSAGPRRGLQLLTSRTWALIVVAGACGGLAWFALELGTAWAARPRWPALEVVHLAGISVAGAIAVVVGGAVVAWVASRSALGRRVLLLFAVPIYVLLITSITYLFQQPVVLTVLTYLPPLAAAGLGLRAIRRSRQRGPDGEQPA